MDNKKIKIDVKTEKTMKLEELQQFQGDLKELSDVNKNKLKRSILKYGFKMPIFIWGKKIIDGHGRALVMQELKKDGYEFGELPVIEINAKSEKEAKEILLLINSKYGEITPDGFENFIKDLDYENIQDQINISELDMSDMFNNEITLNRKDKDLKPISRVHILLSMPIDKFVEIQKILKDIKEKEYIEYEQTQN